MQIVHTHRRLLCARPEEVGVLLDSLGGPEDRLWPRDRWPPLRLDGPLAVGARGGHGPVRYVVSEYRPGRRVAFTFEPGGLTAGLEGHHELEILARQEGVWLIHRLLARCPPLAWIRWWLVIRPLHDALIEDLLDRAEAALHGRVARPARWSWWVRLLRRLLRRRRLDARAVVVG